jgi:hypothetical protein
MDAAREVYPLKSIGFFIKEPITADDPQKFHTFYYDQATLQPENSEDSLLVEAEQLHEKMLGNMTNEVVTSLSDNMSYQPAFAQELCGE